MLPNDRGFEAPDLSIDLRDVPSVGLEPPTEAKLENIDHLTGLHNRRWLDAALAQEITNNPGGFSLLFIDLDGLKTINDKRGHAAGDSHIRTSAEAISQCLRHSTEHDKRLSRPKDDIAEGVVRVGGDEFVVLLRGVSDQSTVDSIQSRIHQRLRNAGVSASIGGRPHLPGESASDLLAATDMLMLRIKRLHHKERIDTLDPPRKIAYYLGRQLLRMSGVNRSAWMR